MPARRWAPPSTPHCQFVLFSWLFTCFLPSISTVDASACFPRPWHNSKPSLHCSQDTQGRAGLPPGRDGANGRWNVYQIQMLFDRRLHAGHLTQVRGSFLEALLPNSPVKRHSSPPSAQPSSLCGSLKLRLTAVPCPASPGSRDIPLGKKAKFRLYFLLNT